MIRHEQDPFHSYDWPKKRKPERRKLSQEDIGKLEALDPERGSKLRIARDAFLFSYYGGGIRFSDICCLKPESIQEERIRYRMLKTGTLVSIPFSDTIGSSPRFITNVPPVP